MKEFVLVFLWFISGIAANHEVHLVPAHVLCENVSKDHDILLPDPHDCSVYYRCENGNAIPQSCPIGLEWCQLLSECTLPILANCTISHKVVTYSPEELATYNSSDTPSPSTPTTPGNPSPEDNICPINGARIPNYLDCKSYYECKNKKPILKQCPSKKSYSCWYGSCVDDKKADCILDGTQDGKKCAKNGAKLGHPDDCTKYYECENKKVVTKSCENGQEFNSWFLQCYKPILSHCHRGTTVTATTPTVGTTPTPSPTTDICPIPGATLPNPLNCNSYYECENDMPVLQECPLGLEYSCWDQQCLPPVISECANNIKENDTCTGNGTKIANPDECHTYYECENGVIKQKHCDDTLKYNQWFEMCLHPQLAHCKPNNVTTTTEKKPSSTPLPSDTDDFCPIDGATLPNPQECNSYYECKDETPHIKYCPDGFEYSCWDQECLPDESANCISENNQTGQPCSNNGDKMQNPNDCNSYYECVDGKVKIQYCTNDLEYNKWYESCMKTSLAHCGSQNTTSSSTTESGITTSPGGTSSDEDEATTYPSTPSSEDNICLINGARIPNYLDCKSYYECKNKKPILKQCPSKKSYSCWYGSCVDDKKADCILDGSQDGKKCAKNGAKLGHPDDCTKYYECENKKVVTKSCENGQEFNSWFLQCYKPILAHCYRGTTVTATTPTVGTTPTPSPTTDICPIPGATLPNPLNCNSYYECQNDVPVLQECPLGLEYSCWDQQCLPPVISECANNIKENDTCTGNGTKIANPDECHTYYECENGVIQKKYCDDTLKYNQWFEMCLHPQLAHCKPNNVTTTTEKKPSSTPPPSDTDDICPIDGATLPNPQECNSYYECKDETPHIKNCPDGFEYSCWDQECLPDESANCISQNNQTGQPCSNNGDKMPNPNDCNSYYECVDGKVEIQYCTNDLEYNKWYESCMKTSLAHCGSQNTTSSSTTESGITTSPGGTSSDEDEATTYPSTPSSEDNICLINGARIPNYLDCKSYYECKNKKPILKQCPSKKSYSCWYGSCVDDKKADCILDGSQDGKKCAKNGAKLGHPDDCTKYYECENKKVVTKSCENGQEFNSWFLQCYKPILAHCHRGTTVTATTPTVGTTPTPSPTTDICPIPGATLPNPLNCNSYYECENDMPVLQECPLGLEYSCWDQQCLPPVISECANNIKENDTCTGNGTKIANPDECHTYYECENGVIKQKHCDDTLKYNQWFEMCLHPQLAHCKPNNVTTTTEKKPSSTPPPSDTDDICPIDGATLPNPQECNSYYECKDETPHIKYCPDGFEYSCWDQECLPDESANCISQNNQTGQPCSNNGDKMQNPNDCNSYYECVDGKVEIQYCTNDLEYNKWYESCMKTSLAHCGSQNTTSSSTTESGITTSPGGTSSDEDEATTYPSTPSSEDNICLINGARIPNYLDCKSYYECKNKKPILKQCPSKKSYSCWYGSCVDDKKADCILDGSQDGKKCAKNGAKLGHPDDCTKYYECENKKVVTKSCENGQEFNSWFLQCYKPILAHCHRGTTVTATTPTVGTTPTPSPTTDICPIPGATLPNPLNCNSYYECENDVPVLQECPLGLEYSCWDQECLSPVVSECANNIKENDTCTGNGTKIANPDECHTYYECENGVIKQKHCDDTLKYNQWFEMCLHPQLAHCKPNNVTTTTEKKPSSTPPPSDTDDICPIDGATLPNPQECNSYYECKDETPHIKYCPDGFEYSCWDQECLPDESANCISQNNQTGQPCSNNGDKMQNPNDCNSYYECVDGKVEIQYCTNDLEYNKWYESCMKTSLAHCGSQNTTSNSTTESGITTSPGGTSSDEDEATTYPSTPSSEDNICLINGARIPNYLDCKSYYECKNKKPILKQCPSKKSYSCWYGSCVDDKKADCILDGSQDGKKCAKNGAKLGHPDDCTKYYECENKKVVTKSCENGQEFNSWFLQCYKPILAHCHRGTTVTATTPTVGTTPTPSPTTDICPIPGATLPNPLNCNSYYECQNDVPVLQECPPGLEYSCWDQECLSPVVSECVNNIKENDTCTGNGTKIANPDECHTYYECENGVIKQKHCDDTLKYNQWFEMCLHPQLAHCKPNNVTTTTEKKPSSTPPPSDTDDICPIDGATLPNPQECNSYYECKDETPHIKYCPDGFEYSCWDQECLPDESANCISQNNQTGQPCSNNGDKMQNPNDCNSYYECVDGKVEIQYCTNDLEYNKWYESCMKTSLAHCDSQNTTSSSTTESGITTSPGGTSSDEDEATTYPSTPSSEDNICLINGARIPNYLDCKSYYECKNKKPILKQCPSKKSYSCWYGSCVDDKKADCILDGSQDGKKCAKNGAKLGHPDDCTKYYECENKKVVTKSCENGQEFNSWFLQCYKPILAHCHRGTTVTATTPTVGTTPTPSPTTDICPIPGATLPNPLNCNSYYECQNDVPVLQECPPGLEYSCWDQECLSPVVSECVNNIKENDTCTGNGTKIANPDECHTYYECENGVIKQKHCDDTLKYNQWFEMCLHPQLAHCKPNNVTTTTEKKPSSTPPPSDTDDICPIDGATLPNPQECNSYYECKDETPHIKYCPDGFEYSCWDQECLPDESANCISQNNQTGQPCSNNGDKMQNPNDCNSYYECVDGKVEIQYCTNDLEYNKWYESCMKTSLAHCDSQNTTSSSTTESGITTSPGGTSSDEDEATTYPSTPSSEDNICLINGARIPNYLDCKSYYECKNKKPILKQCPSKKSYSCWYGSCVDDKKADCILDGSQDGKKCAKNGAKLGHPDDCTKYYECENKKVVTKSCENGQEFNSWFLQCYKPILAHCHRGTTVTATTPTVGTTPTPSPTTDICPIPGATLPNPLNCNSYYECENDMPVLQECPLGLEYSCWDQQCLPPVISECANNIKENDTCTGNGTKIANPDECHTYYECENGVIQKKYCDDTLKYNQWFEMCLHPQLAHCKPNNTPSTTTEKKPSSTPPPSDTNDICPIDGATLPNPQECNSYYECKDETPHINYCPDGFEYSCWDQECLPDESANCISQNNQTGQPCSNNGDKMQNPNDCNSYYECVDGKVEIQYCTNDLEYNKWYESCMKTSLAHCDSQNTTLSSTTESETTTTLGGSSPCQPGTTTPPCGPSSTEVICPHNDVALPNPSNCSLFYQCVNGTPQVRQCNASEEFSSWLGQCVDANTAICIGEGSIEGELCAVNGEQLGYPQDCGKYYECVNNSAVLKSCPLGEEFNVWFGACYEPKLAHCHNYPNITTTTVSTEGTTVTLSPIINICRENGDLLPNLLDCRSYYECQNNTPVEKMCPENLYYSCWDLQCLPQSLAHCSHDVSSNDSCVDNDRMQNPENCHTYYECINGTAELQHCNDSLEYNAWNKICVHPSLSHCVSNINITTTTEQSSSTRPPSESEDICPIEGSTLPNLSDCGSYYQCHNNHAVLKNCTSGYIYSCWDQVCLPALTANCLNKDKQEGQACSTEGQKLPNAQNCSTFYQCVGRMVQLMSCEAGLEFNSWYQNCTKTSLAWCHTYPSIESGSNETNSSETTESTSTTLSTNVTPSASLNICPINGATLPNELNCKSYYECEDQLPVPKQCPSNLAYDCWEQKCTAEEAATCINQGNQEGHSCSNNGEKLPNINNCDSYYQCVNGKVHSQKCADGLFFNQWFGICVEITLAHCQTNSSTGGTTITPDPGYDVCPIEHALLPNPTDCSTYYRCENKIPVLKMCQQGYAYSCWDQKCLPASEADCIAEGSQQDKNCSKEGQRLPNIEDCSGYYECKHGQVITKQCRLGTQFNKWFGICLPQLLSHCVPYSTIPSPSPTTSHPKTTLTPSPDHDICPIDGALLPNPSNCSSYYICENGNPTIRHCAIGLEYSCWEQACLPPVEANCIAVGAQTGKNCSNEGQKTQNPDNCHTYYQCVSGKVETKFCPSSWYYNKWFGICFPSLLLSHCKTEPTKPTPTTAIPITTSAPSQDVDICPIEGALLPDPMDCNAYYKCENQSAVLQHCPTGEEYSCWDQICKPATEAECINSGEQVGKNCSKEGEKLQDPTACSSYYQCIKGVVERQYCFPGFRYNKWYGHCVLFFLSHCKTINETSPPSTKSTPEYLTTPVIQSTPSPSPNADICPVENALLPNPANCSTYYRCQNSTPILQLCQEGLEYSCWDEACLPPKKANCIAVGSQTGNKCSKNGQRMQNPENCHTYYQCANGKVETKVCPLNGYYNKWFEICLPTLLLSHCNTDKPEHPKTTPTSTTTTTYKPITTTVCGTNGAKFPSPKHCRQYYVCENGSPVLYSCPPGYSYDCWDQTCTRTSVTRCIDTGKSFLGDKCTKDGQTVPKVSDCNKYYECVNGIIVEKKCEFLHQYSFWQSKCVVDGLATCANDKFLGII